MSALKPMPKPTPKPPMSWAEILQFPRAHYQVDVGWDYLEKQIESHSSPGYNLDLNPDYQRAHVWTREQQVRYVEYQLEGGEVGKELTFNHTRWDEPRDEDGTYTIVDGKQRLEAVRAFMRDDFRVFANVDPSGEGWLRSEISGRFSGVRISFKWKVCKLKTRADLLRLYLNINAGGTPHAPAELDRVRELLAAEVANPTDSRPAKKRGK